MPSGGKDRVARLKTGEFIHVHEIPRILRNEDAASAIAFYLRWKKMGLPYGSWAFNPNQLIEVVELLEPLDRLYHPTFY